MDYLNYHVSEGVRSRKGAPWVNIYVTRKYLMVVPVGKRWHHVLSIVLAVLFAITFIGNLGGTGDAADTVFLLFVLLVASVIFGYAYKSYKINSLQKMDIKEIARQPGFAAPIETVRIEKSTVYANGRVLELRDKDAKSLAKLLKV